jgi:hypothetical protein
VLFFVRACRILYCLVVCSSKTLVVSYLFSRTGGSGFCPYGWYGSDVAACFLCCRFVNPKGSGTITRKGLINVLDSSLDLSSYALLARKSFYTCCCTGSCWHLDSVTVLAVDVTPILDVSRKSSKCVNLVLDTLKIYNK